MPHLSEDEFLDAVGDALDAMPDEWMNKMRNVVFDVMPEPHPYTEVKPGTDVLGVFIGVPRAAKDAGWQQTPDRIYLFRNAIERNSASADEVRATITRVLRHEIGHYFGINDARLHELGY